MRFFISVLSASAILAGATHSALAQGAATANPIYNVTYDGNVRFPVVGLIRTASVRLVLVIDGNWISGQLFPADGGNGFGIGTSGSIPVKGIFDRGMCRISSDRGDLIEGRCGSDGFRGQITSFGLHQVRQQLATPQIIMQATSFGEVKAKSPSLPFTAVASGKIGLGSRPMDTCAFGAQIVAEIRRRGDPNDPRNALLPNDDDLDAYLRGPGGCPNDYHSYESYQTKIRFFPGNRPYFIDPFAAGAAQAELAKVTQSVEAIGPSDALTEPDLWRYISAYVAFDTVREMYKTLEGYKSIRDYRGASGAYEVDYPLPTPDDMARAERVATGARTRAVRAILWQYSQMRALPTFSLDMCGRYGAAQIAAGYNTQGGNFPADDNSASAQFARFNQQFRIQALPTMMAVFNRISDRTQVVNPETGQYRNQIWKMIPAYECVKDATGYVLVAASNTSAALYDAQMQAALNAARAEADRQAAAARATLARNARAALGNQAPINDDIVHALIDARLEAVQGDRAVVNTMFGRQILSDSFNYKAGIYLEDLAVQKNQIQHRVRNTVCKRSAPSSISFRCTYDGSIAVTTTVLGMTLPRFEMPFSRSEETLTFQNGRWVIDGLVERIREGRKRQAAMGPSYNYADGARKFNCISSNNFADQFGLVRNLGC